MTATDRTDYLLIVTETMLKKYKQLYFANLHKTNSTWIGGRSPTMAKEAKRKDTNWRSPFHTTLTSIPVSLQDCIIS